MVILWAQLVFHLTFYIDTQSPVYQGYIGGGVEDLPRLKVQNIQCSSFAHSDFIKKKAVKLIKSDLPW